jgi:hypothetical protein
MLTELVTAHASETPPPSPGHRQESDPILTSPARLFALPEEVEDARRVVAEMELDC